MKQKSKYKEIYEKYPGLFELGKDTRLPIMFGIETGPGWLPIIEEVCKKITEVDKEGICRFSQIKEKWGWLRIYIYGGTEEIYNVIDWAEEESSKTCETCGSKFLAKTRCPQGWYFTMCLKCYINYILKIKIRNFKWRRKYYINKIKDVLNKLIKE